MQGRVFVDAAGVPHLPCAGAMGAKPKNHQRRFLIQPWSNGTSPWLGRSQRGPNWVVETLEDLGTKSWPGSRTSTNHLPQTWRPPRKSTMLNGWSIGVPVASVKPHVQSQHPHTKSFHAPVPSARAKSSPRTVESCWCGCFHQLLWMSPSILAPWQRPWGPQLLFWASCP